MKIGADISEIPPKNEEISTSLIKIGNTALHDSSRLIDFVECWNGSNIKTDKHSPKLLIYVSN
jgi:hypothetical protein